MENFGYQKLWGWFGLSRASWLTIPRVLMHEMSDEWQGKMADLLDEYDEAWPKFPDVDMHVTVRDRGKFAKLPPHLCNYRYPMREKIEALR